MITEKGTVKTSIVHDENVYRELNKNTRNLGILYIVCGALIFALGVVLLAISLYEGTDDWNLLMIVVGLVFFVLGVFFILLCRKTSGAALKNKRIDELEFFGDYLVENGYIDGELISTNKLYYKWIVRIRETNNYMFLYSTRVTALVVDKNSLPLNELNTIRVLLGRMPQAAPVQTAQSAATPAAHEAPPAEPFGELTENTETTDNKEITEVTDNNEITDNTDIEDNTDNKEE